MAIVRTIGSGGNDDGARIAIHAGCRSPMRRTYAVRGGWSSDERRRASRGQSGGRDRARADVTDAADTSPGRGTQARRPRRSTARLACSRSSACTPRASGGRRGGRRPGTRPPARASRTSRPRRSPRRSRRPRTSSAATSSRGAEVARRSTRSTSASSGTLRAAAAPCTPPRSAGPSRRRAAAAFDRANRPRRCRRRRRSSGGGRPVRRCIQRGQRAMRTMQRGGGDRGTWRGEPWDKEREEAARAYGGPSGRRELVGGRKAPVSVLHPDPSVARNERGSLQDICVRIALVRGRLPDRACCGCMVQAPFLDTRRQVGRSAGSAGVLPRRRSSPLGPEVLAEVVE